MDPEELNLDLLKIAYGNGFFPMPDSENNKILWFHPDPRAIIPLNGFHVSRSLARKIKKNAYQVSFNQDFRGVMAGCADREETWINDQFKDLYAALHDEGSAHSVEISVDGSLVGGLYGVSLGGAFFAESMFSRTTDASKLALYHLVQRLKERKYTLLEVQFLTPHLKSLGCIEISRDSYMARLAKALPQVCKFS